MKAMVVYDSTWGNTEKIAQAIASGIGAGTKALKASSSEAKDLNEVGLLVLGSPILAGRPSAAMQAYVNWLSGAGPKNLSVATFDTRLTAKWVKIFGRASERIAETMKRKGSTLKGNPEGFYVTGPNGPLADGETERAIEWGKALSKL